MELKVLITHQRQKNQDWNKNEKEIPEKAHCLTIEARLNHFFVEPKQS